MFPSLGNAIVTGKRCKVEENREEKIKEKREEKRDSSLDKSLKLCTDCRTSDTPLWRSGPHGPKSLCNACGIRYSKRRRMNFKKVKERKPDAGSCRSGGLPDAAEVTLETEEMKRRQREKQEKLLSALLRRPKEANWSCRKCGPANSGGAADCEEVAEAARLLLTLSSEMSNHT